jgi:hypothetical protein
MATPRLLLAVFALTTLCLMSRSVFAVGEVEITTIDQATGEQIPCRIHLMGEQGKARKIPRLPFWHDHAAFDGKLDLKLPRGHYTFVLEHGPELLSREGYFTLDNFARDAKQVDFRRFVNMAEHRWYSGDLFVRRPPGDMKLLMRADDLHVAEVVTWTEKKNEWANRKLPEDPVTTFDKDWAYQSLAGADLSRGVVFLNLSEPLELPAKLSGMQLLEKMKEARKQGGWVHVDRADAWDFPAWVAAGAVDSVAVADSRLERKGTGKLPANSRARDTAVYPDPHGHGRWVQDIYFHLLECGLKITPAAGSGSGVSPNPVGYNRVYALLEDDFSYDAWFEALRAGRVMVTNGPLLRPAIFRNPPGHVFEAPAGRPLELELALHLGAKEKIAYLEIIQNGRVAKEIRVEEFAKSGQLPPIRFENSGWCLARVVTDSADTYRFGLSGPFFVEMGGEKRISRRSAEFFVSWAEERLAQAPAADKKMHEDAVAYWKALAERSNDE